MERPLLPEPLKTQVFAIALLASAVFLLLSWFWSAGAYAGERARGGPSGALSTFFAVSVISIIGIAASTAGLIYWRVMMQ